MIEEKYILELLKNFASTAEGKKAIKDKYGIDYDPKKDKGSTLHKWGDKMKSILYKHIKPVIKSISDKDIFVGTPIKDKNGKYKITISLQNVRRESLQPEKYPQGVDDIVLLFSSGWNARGSIRGKWHGQDDVISKRSRDPNPFVNNAIDEFNRIAKGIATAKTTGKYRNIR